VAVVNQKQLETTIARGSHDEISEKEIDLLSRQLEQRCRDEGIEYRGAAETSPVLSMLRERVERS
jgi:hypothetical protein